MNINTMNDSAIAKTLASPIKAKGCTYGSLFEAVWWAQGLETPEVLLKEGIADYYKSLTLKQKIVYDALITGAISVTYPKLSATPIIERL